MANINPRWSKPSTILFATEIPTNEKAFAFALAQAAELSASIIVFHANGRLDVTDTEASGPSLVDYATARAMKERLEPLARRAKALGIECNIVVRSGLACDQILSLLRERKIDRVVIGSRSPGPIGKRLVGSVAEAVLRTADVPVCIVGPNVNEGSFHNLDTRTILCDVSTEAVRRAWRASLRKWLQRTKLTFSCTRSSALRKAQKYWPAALSARLRPNYCLWFPPSLRPMSMCAQWWWLVTQLRNCSTKAENSEPTLW